MKNICSPLKSKPKRYDTQKYIPTLGTKSVPKPYVESVPIRTQSWTKYFWTNFGYTLCTKGIPMYKSGSGHTSSCHIFCHASHEDHKHNKKYYHRDHGSHCPTSIMQRHHHISATAGPNPLKINDDKVYSLFYNSFQFQRSCFVFRWSGYNTIMSIHQRSRNPHHYHYNLCRFIRSEHYYI